MMAQENRARKRTAQQMRRQMFVTMCYAYIVLGVCSIVAGCLIYALPFLPGSKLPKQIHFGLLIVVLIGFGVARIGTALVNLRRIKRAKPSA